mmetsp:Transcript_23890/g.52185  ORF Transcript_23890/g.52185 Transcript_23890/m.52185 type:complete len:287 (+) Transcript_23890:319-1179(+)|eukprot:CAMPEP_0118938012 /NCGR_PEP_ID=MMETSP1169-20130426/24530_1 /TAXON_ID=36882 /ORGANISM="Pyramimonas obovata, Strain CCMP722" /LENGTH=286 /DNA_ID=CAMNT_0006881831 /DNA_START=219 /DNA_END=1079 /DNA_ORIENTATION=-
MSRIEALESSLKASVALLPPVLRSCSSHVLAERIYPTFQESEFRGQPAKKLDASIGQTKWSELAEAASGSSNKSGNNDASLHTSTAQLEEVLRSAQDDSVPDLRGLLPMKVAATTPTPPPWVVSCKLCQGVVLASRFRSHMDKCLAMQAAEQSGNGTGHDLEPKMLKHSSNKSKKSGGTESGGSNVKRKRTALMRDGTGKFGSEELQGVSAAEALRLGRNRPRKTILLSDEAALRAKARKSSGGDSMQGRSAAAGPALLFQPISYRWHRNLNLQGLLASMYYNTPK